MAGGGTWPEPLAVLAADQGAGDSAPGARLRSGPGLPLACVPSACPPCIPSRDGILARSGRALAGSSRAGQVRRGNEARGLNHHPGGIVTGPPARPPMDRQRAVRIFTRPHRRLDEVRAQPAGRQPRAQPVPLHRVAVARRPVFLDAQALAPCPHGTGGERRALLFGGGANIVLCSAMRVSPSQRLAAPAVVIPASPSSFGRRSWSVGNTRSERPRAWGE